jgi:uncharacterized protein
VRWFPWGDEAFALAEKLGRPVFLSVGYSTCHWCHVMEEESFEDEAVAAYLNAHYVPVKVDREERPDVDAVYMRALQRITGGGGWPMSLWLTPAREPFYAATYLPARDGERGVEKGFVTRLEEQAAAFRADPAQIAKDAARIVATVRADMRPARAGEVATQEAIVAAVGLADRRYDRREGGARGRPKFPSGFPVRLLLRFARRAGDDDVRAMAIETLRKMAAGGIHDHVGGGFHRYAVDERWRVPHFEKMLYDNALLAVAYLEGYQASGDRDLEAVVRSTLDYVLREMTSPEGAFYTATDADSLAPGGAREEGRFFTWTPAEIHGALDEQTARAAIAWFSVSEKGELDGRNVLHTPRTREAVAAELSITPAALETRIAAAKQGLRQARARRPAPLRDDKILAGHNGLMIGALARAALVLDEPRYREAAVRAARFVVGELAAGGLRHAHGAPGAAFAEDHAFLAEGLLDLFEATGDGRWLERARAEAEHLHARFRSPEGGFFRTTTDHEALLVREVEARDGALPAASSVALMTELRLHGLTGDDRWRERAETTLRGFAEPLRAAPWSLEHMLLAVDYHDEGGKEVLVVLPEGDDGAALSRVVREGFVPNRVLVLERDDAIEEQVPWARGKIAKQGRATAYVCERGACELPTTDPEVLARQLSQRRPYLR